MLKSPVSRRREEREDAMVRTSESSERKGGCALGTVNENRGNRVGEGEGEVFKG